MNTNADRYNGQSPLSVVGAILLGIAVLMLGMYLLNNWYPSNVSSEPMVVWKGGSQAHGFAAQALSRPRVVVSPAGLGDASRNPATDEVRREMTPGRSQ